MVERASVEFGPMTTTQFDSTPAHVRAIWAAVFPHVKRVPLRRLPASCATRPRVFVYNLSSRWHADLLASMERGRGTANCDYARSPCPEESHSSTGKNWDYSNLRQYAAEVPLLAKLLSLPHAAAPNEADLFVVPWFAATELSSARRRQWNPHNQLSASRFRALLSLLTHFEAAPRRHVFLSTREHSTVITPLKLLVQRTGAFLLHYGPRRPDAPHEILVPPNGAGFGHPLAPLQPQPRHLLFAMFDAARNFVRHAHDRELRALNASRPDLAVLYHPIGNHRGLSLPPRRALEEMRSSLLCPTPQGDTPYQKRVFDSIAAGCVPLFLTYSWCALRPVFAVPLAHAAFTRPPRDLYATATRPLRDRHATFTLPPRDRPRGRPRSTLAGGPPCDAWSWDPRSEVPQTYDRRGRRGLTYPSACSNYTLPFPATVPWASISVRLEAAGMLAVENRMRRALLGLAAHLPRSRAEETRRVLDRYRGHFLYDWSGAPPLPPTSPKLQTGPPSSLIPEGRNRAVHAGGPSPPLTERPSDRPPRRGQLRRLLVRARGDVPRAGHAAALRTALSWRGRCRRRRRRRRSRAERVSLSGLAAARLSAEREQAEARACRWTETLTPTLEAVSRW